MALVLLRRLQRLGEFLVLRLRLMNSLVPCGLCAIVVGVGAWLFGFSLIFSVRYYKDIVCFH